MRQSLLLYGSGSRGDWVYVSLAPATFTTFGTGCPGSLGDPTLDAAPNSLPWTGDTFAVEFGNLPAGSLPFLAIGFGRAMPPISLAGLGLPGCTQYTTSEVGLLLSLNGSTATWPLAVPARASLVGLPLFFQGLAFNAGGNNALGAAQSNAGEAVIGMR